MRHPSIFSWLLLFAALASANITVAAQTPADACAALSNLKLPDTTITLASTVEAGEFELPANYVDRSSSSFFKAIPAFCRIAATVKPSPDSDIKVEVWLPVSGWNGKYLSHGNGGFAGGIFYPSLAVGLKHGYAMAGTDTGHSGAPTDVSWALGHPEKIKDFGYRAIHEMTLKAKAIIHAYYGKDPQHSYFSGCSNGGRQGLMEAQRFPEDYDGIIAGAPANYFTHLFAAGTWNVQALQKDTASYISPSRIPAIADAVLAACDAQDGVKDGIINDPSACHFDPAALLCKDADSSCLTGPQVTALQKIYAGPKNSKGEKLFPGLAVGGEKGLGGWSLWITGNAPGKSLGYIFSTHFFANMVFDNPAWDFKTLNFDGDMQTTDDKQAANLNAIDPKLKKFKARGGKLIIYHGWSDAGISPFNTVNYFNNVEKLWALTKPPHLRGSTWPPAYNIVAAARGQTSSAQMKAARAHLIRNIVCSARWNNG